MSLIDDFCDPILHYATSFLRAFPSHVQIRGYEPAYVDTCTCYPQRTTLFTDCLKQELGRDAGARQARTGKNYIGSQRHIRAGDKMVNPLPLPVHFFCKSAHTLHLLLLARSVGRIESGRIYLPIIPTCQ